MTLPNKEVQDQGGTSWIIENSTGSEETNSSIKKKFPRSEASNQRIGNKQYERDIVLPRLYFRVLRTDEDINCLKPKSTICKKDGKTMDQLVLEHVRYGSQTGYESPLISLTAELHVALSFGGIVSKIALVDITGKPTSDVQHMDKEYLRQFLTDTDAIARSRRSDEVLVFGELRKTAELLDVNILDCERKLATAFEKEDAYFFPEKITTLKTVKSLGGSNKRLFQIMVDGKKWVACLPRPNYSLDDPVLFGVDLVARCEHHFSCFCAYRCLTKQSPRCAMYTFTLQVNNRNIIKKPFKWSFILMENIEKISPEEALSAAQNLFAADILLGNWENVNGKNLEELASVENINFGVTSTGIIVKIGVDRSLGCIYPEDESKHKQTLRFEVNNVDQLKNQLQESHKWCFGTIDNKDLTQKIMDLKLDDPMTMKNLKTTLCSQNWPSWINSENKDSLWKVLENRVCYLLEKLPFHKMCPPLCYPELRQPEPRDGHGAVSRGNYLYIAGGNSMKGPLKYLWRFDVKSHEWEQLKSMPTESRPRYSFSMHIWNECIVVFGGCDPTRRKGFGGMLGDLLIYDIDKNDWKIIENNQNNSKARCRQGSHLTHQDDGSAEMLIYGGSTGKDSKNEVWKLTLFGKWPNIQHKWIQMKDLERKTHRCFSFALENRVFLIGGFGRNLMKLEEVNENKTITTHCPLPSSEKKYFTESKSLAGFGAVYDEVDKQLILVGGGNLSKTTNTALIPENREFGNVPAMAKIQPRILRLKYGKDTKMKDEWKWEINNIYEALDVKHKLPDLSSWSASMIDHDVVLFGGRRDRRGKEFSNTVYKIQLRTQYKHDLDKIKIMSKMLTSTLAKTCQNYGEYAKKEEIINSAKEALSFLERNREPSICMKTLRLLSLNVHGWSTPDRSQLTDMDVIEMVELYNPDVLCLQEVKHPMPANPSNGMHIVRVNRVDKSQILRYADTDTGADIASHLDIKGDITNDMKKFIDNQEYRRSQKYLAKVFDANVKITNSNETVLEKISKKMQGKFTFKSARDETFGNAIISSISNNFDGKTIEVGDNLEKRSVCKTILNIFGNWDCAIVNLHLDEKLEATRIHQLRLIMEWLNSASTYLPHILCGDFNALSAWSSSTEEVRCCLGFEAPTDDLYKILINEYNYFDMEDNPCPRETSSHGTRVDYILCSEALRPRLLPHKLSVLPSPSDHKALLTILTVNTKKLLIGITGKPGSDSFTTALEVGRKLHKEHHIINTDDFRKLRESSDRTNAFDLKKCFSTVFKKLSMVDVVIVRGQDLDLLSASLDLLFVLNIPDETCKQRYFPTTEKNNITKKQSQYWKNFVSCNWNRQLDVFNQLSTNQNGPCQKVNWISNENSSDQIISAITMYITLLDK